jgi:hypothetical protein
MLNALFVYIIFFRTRTHPELFLFRTRGANENEDDARFKLTFLRFLEKIQKPPKILIQNFE